MVISIENTFYGKMAFLDKVIKARSLKKEHFNMKFLFDIKQKRIKIFLASTDAIRF